ncbi:MAG: inorganic phosphate transporter [Ignavibacteria bacterium]|nr:inorganic phosphate transporter [Ignavibacteria bacterium]
MEIALIFVIVVVSLSIVDLIVGVANDAVNFLNSAVGSKVTTLKKALFFASIGILLGVLFSSGMMEIARKGIFNPYAFTLYDVLVIFVAYVFTDILLLDFFNTYGIPTSTTVSLVSSITGGALVISLIYILSGDNSAQGIDYYLNLSKITTIFISIVASIILAFIFGFWGQFLSRLIFTFDFVNIFKKIGPLWAGFSVTFILFFISIKGLEGSVFVTPSVELFVKSHLWWLLLVAFLGTSAIFYILTYLVKTNILKIIVLIGTSALAMSFASNDLVNFVGPAFASLNAYEIALNSQSGLTANMSPLSEPIKAQTSILLLCGLIMVLTLYLSKKARTVTSTEVNLGRQHEGYEAFEPFPLARSLVRAISSTTSFILGLIPQSIKEKVNKRFDTSKMHLLTDGSGDRASFDLIRATVNLTISAGLISLGTALKLPLSTTYVTFIVAMATALADRAWGREYAVYRVSGILAVIGGWFLTAIICSITSGIIALIIYHTSVYGVLAFLVVFIFIFTRSALIHRKREKQRKLAEEKIRIQQLNVRESLALFVSDIVAFLKDVRSCLELCVQGISKYKLKELKKAKKISDELAKKTEYLYIDFARNFKNLDDGTFENLHSFVPIVNDLNLIAFHLNTMSTKCMAYVDNSQRPLTNNQLSELKVVTKHFNALYNKLFAFLDSNLTIIPSDIKLQEDEFLKEINRIKEYYFKAIRRPEANLKRATMYLLLLDNLFALSQRTISLVEYLNKFKIFIDSWFKTPLSKELLKER